MAAEFTNRTDAGRILAGALERFANRSGTIVLALPRGGVPVAYEVAHALKLPLDVLIVRKLGLPGHPELAMGAIASGGSYIMNREVVDAAGITSAQFSAVLAGEMEELHRRERVYRGSRPPLDVRGKTAILVDDGLATGSTMEAAIGALRRGSPSQIVAAVPVAPPESCRALERSADEVVCLLEAEPFVSVSAHYVTFGQVGDTEVRQLLARSAAESAA